MAWDGYPQRRWLGHPPELWIGSLLYFVIGFGAIWVVKNADVGDAARLAIGLTPTFALILVARAVLRMIRQQDELYKRIQFEAIACAAGIVMVLSFTLGMLESMDLIPTVSSNWAGQVLLLAWAIGAGILNRRYG
jgi:hypothetical protein